MSTDIRPTQRPPSGCRSICRPYLLVSFFASKKGGDIDSASLTAFLALLCGVVAATPLPWVGAAPVLRKTSPSGGSRHPTEVYALIRGVPGIASGWWHVNSGDAVLERIGQAPPENERAASVQEVAPVFTRNPSRNRYRYREPRTFRTVHMDVGHLLGSCELLARAAGWHSSSSTHVNAAVLAEALSLDMLLEAPIALSQLKPDVVG